MEGDRAEVQLTAEQVGDTGVTADSRTKLHGNVLSQVRPGRDLYARRASADALQFHLAFP
jgi:hypothetical protein